LLGVETDYPGMCWDSVEQAFLVVFVTELVLRMGYNGCKYFVRRGHVFWNWFDLIIVGLGVSESWIIPQLASGMNSSSTLAIRSLRLLRLLRLLRMFRLLSYLQKFMDAMVDMIPTLMWIFGILFLFCYVTAIVLTHMLGKMEALSGLDVSQEDQDELLAEFGDLCTTMFTLFRIVTMDNWHTTALRVTKYLPTWRIFFVAFIVFGSWTMISLLTAVVSDHMLAATADLNEVERRRAHETRLAFLAYLQKSFHEADSDGNGNLDRAEFVEWTKDESILRKLHQVGIEMQSGELISLFDMFDIDGTGQLSIDEFVHGFARTQDSLGMNHFLALEHMIKRMDRQVDIVRQSVDDVVTAVDARGGPTVSTWSVGSSPSAKLSHKVAQLEEIVQTLADQQRSLVGEQANVSEAMRGCQGKLDAIASALQTGGGDGGGGRRVGAGGA